MHIRISKKTLYLVRIIKLFNAVAGRTKKHAARVPSVGKSCPRDSGNERRWVRAEVASAAPAHAVELDARARACARARALALARGRRRPRLGGQLPARGGAGARRGAAGPRPGRAPPRPRPHHWPRLRARPPPQPRKDHQARDKQAEAAQR